MKLRSALAVTIAVSLLSACNNPPPDITEQLCLIITHQMEDISRVSSVHICLRENDRLVSEHDSEVVVVEWERVKNSATDLPGNSLPGNVYVLKFKLMSQGGEYLFESVKKGQVVKFPLVLPGYKIEVAGKQWDLSKSYATVE